MNNTDAALKWAYKQLQLKAGERPTGGVKIAGRAILYTDMLGALGQLIEDMDSCRLVVRHTCKTCGAYNCAPYKKRGVCWKPADALTSSRQETDFCSAWRSRERTSYEWESTQEDEPIGDVPGDDPQGP